MNSDNQWEISIQSVSVSNEKSVSVSVSNPYYNQYPIQFQYAHLVFSTSPVLPCARLPCRLYRQGEAQGRDDHSDLCTRYRHLCRIFLSHVCLLTSQSPAQAPPPRHSASLPAPRHPPVSLPGPRRRQPLADVHSSLACHIKVSRQGTPPMTGYLHQLLRPQ